MTDTKIDRPITGEINRASRNSTPQLGPAEFLAAIDGLLDRPSVASIRWAQYTPYFNDGDPCEFGVREMQLRFDGIKVDDTDYGDDYLTAWEFTDWKTDKTIDVPGLTEAQVLEIKEALSSFSTSAFETVMRDNFGDHAEVTATKDGFSVDEYEHD